MSPRHSVHPYTYPMPSPKRKAPRRRLLYISIFSLLLLVTFRPRSTSASASTSPPPTQRTLPIPSHCADWQSVARNLQDLHLYREHFTSHDLTDWFIYVNFFHAHWQNSLSRPPRYIDIAANHARKWSATYFLDRCLDWAGYCVEANPKYWRELSRQRSCNLVKDCVSDRVRDVNFSMTDAYGGVVAGGRGGGVNVSLHQSNKFRKLYGGVRRMTCQPVHAVIPGGYYDFLSLDVEGHEYNVLKGIDWASMTFGVIITENRSPKVRKLLSGLGYTVVSGVLNDDIWIGPGEEFRVGRGMKRLMKGFNRTSYMFNVSDFDFEGMK